MFVDMAMLVENQVSCKLNNSWHDQIVKSAHEPEGYFEHSFFSDSVRESN